MAFGGFFSNFLPDYNSDDDQAALNELALQAQLQQAPSAALPYVPPVIDQAALMREAVDAESPLGQIYVPGDLMPETVDAEAPLFKRRRTPKMMREMRDAEAPLSPREKPSAEFVREATDAEANIRPRRKRRSRALVRETVDAEAPLFTRWNVDRLFEKAMKPRK